MWPAVRGVTFSFLWDFCRFHGTIREIRDYSRKCHPAGPRERGLERAAIAPLALADEAGATKRVSVGFRLIGLTLMVITVSLMLFEILCRFGIIEGEGLEGLKEGEPPVKDKPGYWGQKTHIVEPPWCEADYEITTYVAEFWNTLTSCSMCARFCSNVHLYCKIVH
eukprot:SAG31_NODE_16826_length_694_cov_0.961345_1_plen_166_part_00